jgi:hypothetical protein
VGARLSHKLCQGHPADVFGRAASTPTKMPECTLIGSITYRAPKAQPSGRRVWRWRARDRCSSWSHEFCQQRRPSDYVRLSG